MSFAVQNNEKTMTTQRKTSRKNGRVPRLWVKKGDSLKTIYTKARRAITAADLQKYTEIEDGIPFEQVIAAAEAIHREETAKRSQKKTKVKKTKARKQA
jgi:hypothetical protein